MIKKIIDKYWDVIPYLFFGVCTTLVNVVVYWFCAYPLKLETTASTIIAWMLAVLFAYITNRKWVFRSESRGIRKVSNEVISFLGCRLVTGVVDWLCMFIFVELLGVNDIVIKAGANIIVIVLNYIAGKFVIFKKSVVRGKNKICIEEKRHINKKLKPIQDKLAFAISLIFIAAISIIVFCSLFCGRYVRVSVYASNSILVLLMGILLTVGILSLAHRFFRKQDLSLKQEIVLLVIFFGILLIVEYFIAKYLSVHYSWDLNEVYWGIKGLLEDGKLGNSAYFDRYPYQIILAHAGCFFAKMVWKINSSISIQACLTMLNILAINVSILLIYLINRKMFGIRKAFFALFLFCAFTPLLLYIPIFYTDTMAMPFLLLCILCYLIMIDGKRTAKERKLIAAIIFAVSMFFATAFKATSIILFIAILMHILLNLRKGSVKNIIKYAAIFIVVFMPLRVTFIYIKSLETDSAKAIPVAHWLAMGAGYQAENEPIYNPYRIGGYNGEDVNETLSAIENGQNASAMNLEKIKERYGSRTIIENISFLSQKIAATWSDGTYGISEHLGKLPSQPQSILFKIVGINEENKGSAVYLLFSHSLQISMFGILLAGCILTRRKKDISLLFKLCLIGIFVFLLFWETTSRYLLSFLPIFITLLNYSINVICEKIDKGSLSLLKIRKHL